MISGSIKLLNVGDGDAIIAQIHKANETLLMVIDGARKKDYKEKLKPELQRVLSDLNKIAPDIVVATHYDADHIAGLIPLIEDYIDDIKEVWVHKSPELVNFSNYSKMVTGKTIQPIIEESLKYKQTNPKLFTKKLTERYPYIFESIKQLNTFINLIPNNKIKEVYHNYQPEGWPEIRVLGPTKDFYDKLFPSDKSFESLVFEEALIYEDFDYQQDIIKQQNLMYKEDLNPCSRLKDDQSAKITPTNEASIIFSIEKGTQKLLFTGDAGIKSFKAIPNWEDELKNLFWLKIPHHGSDNNMTKEMVEIMKPKYADSTGSHHQDDAVLKCISKNSRSERDVRSTKKVGDIIFNF